jgi:hypothetical protein
MGILHGIVLHVLDFKQVTKRIGFARRVEALAWEHVLDQRGFNYATTQGIGKP